MDNIWYRNPSKSEVIGRCGGMKKTNDQMLNAKKIYKNTVFFPSLEQLQFNKIYQFWLNTFREKPPTSCVRLNVPPPFYTGYT